ncbi:C4-dicarboxylate ABC transporter [Oligella urethralis]|uniref:TRAP transporter substrate-binding protein n=1 Tax=Oligella urethralis TaxID=90245 RepID=UPI000CFE7DEE|nr:TRAP transporter substrate-binding protein [Oligella urethralis]AVL70892.1 C4-dicarboxylate ABC transporter [Oligella urethralis]
MKKFFCAVALSTLTLAMTNVSYAQATKVLRLSHNAAPNNPKSDGSLLFAKLVEEKTEGRIKVEVGGSAQYGDDTETLTNLRLGTIAFSANSQGTTSTVVPEIALIGLPFLFKDLDHAYQVVDSEVGEEIKKAARKKGLEILAFWDNGIRHTSNNQHPIIDPADLKGLKIRTPPDPMTIDIFEQLGASPVSLAFSELYIALQQKVVDGQENPLMNIYSSKLHEVQKYISFTGHKYETTPFIMSKMLFDSLSADDQKLIIEAAMEAKDFNRAESKKADEELKVKLTEAGVELNEINDIEEFRALTNPVYDKWRKKYPELVDKVVKGAEQG